MYVLNFLAYFQFEIILFSSKNLITILLASLSGTAPVLQERKLSPGSEMTWASIPPESNMRTPTLCSSQTQAPVQLLLNMLSENPLDYSVDTESIWASDFL